MDWEVVDADCASAAIDVLKQDSNIALILVDWNMPGMSGLELVRTIKEQGYAPEAKIMMVTSEVKMDRVAEALEQGADEYLMKPFTANLVAEKLSLLGFGDSEVL